MRLSSTLGLAAVLLGCGGASRTPDRAPQPSAAQNAPSPPAASSSQQPERPAEQGAAAYEIVNLYDDFGRDRPGVEFDFGFSALVRYGDLTILFDAGSQADILAKNTAALGVDLRSVDVAILSHQHPDHHGGFTHLLKTNPGVKIYAPADIFIGGTMAFDTTGPDPGAGDRLPPEQRYRASEPGAKNSITTTGMFGEADVTYVGAHTEIAPGATLVFTRSDLMGYFNAYPPNRNTPKHVGLAEISLSLRTTSGEVLVVGCSHSSVEAIVKATREHLQRPIDLLMGGYHLLPYDAESIRGIAKRMRDEYEVHRVAPAHCSGHLAFETFRQLYQEGYVMAGLGERIAFRREPAKTSP